MFLANRAPALAVHSRYHGAAVAGLALVMLKSHARLGTRIAVLSGLLIASAESASAQAPINVFVPAQGRPCTPEPGWRYCFILTDSQIKVQAVDGTSDTARMAVANIYAQITARLSTRYPRNTFYGYKVYLTNGKPWSELANLQPVGSMHSAKTGEWSGDWLRGGATLNYLWIDEQMICKTGVATRGGKDTTARTFDQVIHEFGHAISSRLGLDARVNQMLGGQPNAPAGERFAWSVQYWFTSPNGYDQAAHPLMVELFTSRAIFSCQGYRR